MNWYQVLSITILSTWVGLTQANTFKTERWTTSNGVHVVFYQAMEVPMLDISLAFAAGSAYDEHSAGLSSLTTQLLNEGSAGISAMNIAEELANTGAQFDATTNKDMVILNLRTLTKNDVLNKATTLFSQIVTRPDFPQEAIDREKKQLIMAIEHSKDSAGEQATLLFFQQLYQNHPYAHPVNGTAQTIQAISKKQITSFYQRFFVGHNAVLVLVGAINKEKAHQIAQQITSPLPAGIAAPPITHAQALAHEEQVHTIVPSTQTVIRLGQLGIDHQNPHYFPLIVGNYILGGGGLTSRLAIELREKKGLTYNVDSQLVPMPGLGPFFIGFSTQKEQTSEAIALSKQVLNEFIAQGPSQEELLAAKKYLNGSFPMSLASNKAIANLLLRMTFYHLPAHYLSTYLAHINDVTINDIKKAFQEEIKPDSLLLVTAGQS